MSPAPRNRAYGRAALAAMLGLASGPWSATTVFAQTALAGAPATSVPARTPSPHPPSPHPFSAPASASAPASVGAQIVRVSTGAGEARQLSLPRGKAAVIELPVDARDVMISDPKIADVALSTPRRIYVTGVKSGQTDAVFMDGMGRQILRLDIRVDQDTSAVAQTLARLSPNSAIRVEAAGDSLVLSGEATSLAEADKAVRLAGAFVDDPKKVINLLAIASGDQVMLKVKIIEVNRQVIKQLGFDLSAVLGQLGGPQYSLGKAVTYGVQGALLGGITGGYSADTTQQPTMQVPCAGGTGTCLQTTGSKGPLTIFQGVTDPTTGKAVIDPATGLQKVVPVQVNNTNTATITKTAGSSGLNSAKSMIQAFERVGLIRTLAEPNLTTTSGEAARFLAGGEFPVPGAQDATGRITVEFKQYGVGLGFTPVVLSSGRISLKLSTEVSEISNVGAFTTSSGANANGTSTSLTVPGLTVRRAETVVELPSGGAMAIAGLMQSQSKQTLDSLPGLNQVPIIGTLLRSRDFQNNESELVVIVTPYIVKAVRPDQLSTPADGLVIASDVETNLLGHLNSGFGKPATAAAGQTYQGPFGYVVD